MAIDTEYAGYLNTIITEMTKSDSFMDLQDKEIEKQFNRFGLTNEQVALVISQTAAAKMQFVNQFATAGAMELIKEQRAQELADAEILRIQAQTDLIKEQIKKEIEQTNLVLAQIALIERQDKGYDDNLFVKAAEYEGGLASFAVNADSANAQVAIDKFVESVEQLKDRAGATVQPRVTIGDITATTIELDWFEIKDATVYTIFVDGEFLATTTELGYLITGLTTATAYNIVVTATKDGVSSPTSRSNEVTTL